MWLCSGTYSRVTGISRFARQEGVMSYLLFWTAFLELLRLRVIASRSTPSFPAAIPVQIGVNGADDDVTACLLPPFLAHLKNHVGEFRLGGVLIGQER